MLFIILDFVLLWVSISAATLLRYDGKLPEAKKLEILYLSFITFFFYSLIKLFLNLYSDKFKGSSVEEIIIISLITLGVSFVLFIFRLISDFPKLPRSVPIIGALIFLFFTLLISLSKRPYVMKIFIFKKNGEPTLIYGAGITGKYLVERMLDSDSNYNPIGFLDDDPNKFRSRILGRTVLGNIHDLPNFARVYKVKTLIISFFNINSSNLIEIERVCKEFDIKLKIVPNIFDMTSESFSLKEITDVSEEDFVGRFAIKLQENDLATYFCEKTILVTGAAGSIGSEIVKQVIQYGPKKVFMLDRDENGLHALGLKLKRPLLDQGSVILCDIRDEKSIHEIFEVIKPEIVFHAAALKHVNFLEKFPSEAFKTNILGTLNLLNAARDNSVEIFVNISTDKAAQPISILGKSKLITERLVAAFNENSKVLNSKFISVRFGNVIGSNGSFIKTFKEQIMNGGPVTVTDPDVKRFFMTIAEAVHLVLNASTLGAGGETFVLDMGEPVRIEDIAKRMIDKSGQKIEIVYTGLRSGEKISEELFNPDEQIYSTENSYIRRTKVSPMKVEEISMDLLK